MKTLLTILFFQLFFLYSFAQKWQHFSGSGHLPNDTILFLSTASDRLLIGTKSGAAIRQNGQTNFLTTAEGLASNQVDFITGSDSGELMLYHADVSELTWISSMGNVQTYVLSSVVSETGIQDLVYSNDGYFYLRGQELHAFKNGVFSNVSTKSGQIVPGPNNHLYQLNNSGTVYRYTNASMVDSIVPNSSQNIQFARFLHSNHQEVYLTALPPATFQVFEDRMDTLSSALPNQIMNLYPDSEGQLWRVEKSVVSRGKMNYESTSIAAINHPFRVEVNPVEVNDSIFIAVSSGYVAAPLDVKFNSIEYLNVNNFNFKINPDGTVGSTPYPESVLEPNTFNAATFARIKDVNVLFTGGGLWLAGVTSQGDTLDAGERYSGEYNGQLSPYDFDLAAGPMAASYNHERNYQTHLITSNDINTHQQNLGQPGYNTPDEFIDWPTHGVPQTGEAGCLAPFNDVDGDGKYIPQAGDYPQMRGDVAAYTISNDDYLREFFPNTPMGIEIHRMYYGFESTDPELNNTLFLNVRIVNRGDHDFTSFRWGIYNDFDLGNPQDDYVGCDTALNMAFVYNGDDEDENNGGSKGFGVSPPAFGVMMLNDEMKSHLSLSNNANRPFSDFPVYSFQRYNLLSGKTVNGVGLQDTLANGDESTYMFYGSPLDPNAQNELNAGNAPYDRRSLVGGDEHVLTPGDTLEFDIAFVFAENPGTEGAEAYPALVAQAEAVQNWYNNQTFEPWQTACTPISVGTREQETANSSFKLYPNPAENEIRISGMEGSFSYRIFNLQGQLMQAGMATSQEAIPLKNVNPGMYLVQIDQEEVLKLLIR